MKPPDTRADRIVERKLAKAQRRGKHEHRRQPKRQAQPPARQQSHARP
jgi:hypothetical protein